MTRQAKHGMYGTPTYLSWAAMIARCTRPSNQAYARYGGRGITVCEKWRTFEGFYADIGDRPADRTLDRIDNDGNYEPGNCRWATTVEQRQNRRPSPHPESLVTHCPQNHPYDDENTYVVPKTGWRQCRTCMRARNQARRLTSTTRS